MGSNISLTHWLGQDMMHTARHSTPEGHLPTVHSLAGSSADESPAESSSSSSSVDGLSAAAVAAGVSAAVGHEETLGTATVYRSRTKELEGGAWQCLMAAAGSTSYILGYQGASSHCLSWHVAVCLRALCLLAAGKVPRLLC